MSWTDQGAAVPLARSGSPDGYLAVTGTSTVRLTGSSMAASSSTHVISSVPISSLGGLADSVDLGVGLPTTGRATEDDAPDWLQELTKIGGPQQVEVAPWFLRMYFPWSSSLVSNSLLGDGHLSEWSSAVPVGTPANLLTVGVVASPVYPQHYLYWLDSAQDSADFAWSLSAGTGAPLRPTGIPMLRNAVALDVSLLYAPGSSSVDSGTFWAVKYDHPRVVQTPSGMWLLLLARQMIGTVLDPEGARGLEDAFSGVTDPASESLRDIVAYLSPTPDFTGVWGPVTLLSGLDAVPGQTLRLWPGVPTGVFVDDVLQLYYTIQPGQKPYDLDDVGVEDAAYPGLRENEFSGYPRLAAGRGAIGLKTIEWTTLEPAFLASAAESADIADVLAGDLEGTVRFWIADGSKYSEELLFTRLEEHLTVLYRLDFSTTTDAVYRPNIVDPDVVLCADGSLTIYVTLRAGVATDHLDGMSGMGVWRGTIVDPTSLGRAARTTGLDS